MKYKLSGLGLLLLIWYICALLVDREVILPMPFNVFIRMISIVQETYFISGLLYTCGRVILSFLIALILGVGLGIVAGIYKPVSLFLEPIFTIIQSIPQIAYILLLIVWFKGTVAIILMIFIMIFPNFYHNAKQGIQSMDRDLKDVIISYNHPFVFMVKKIYLPTIKPQISSAIHTCLPLSFKVGIMAEVFIQSQIGIGSVIYFYRTSIDMTSIFACVIWCIILIILCSSITKYICKE